MVRSYSCRPKTQKTRPSNKAQGDTDTTRPVMKGRVEMSRDKDGLEGRIDHDNSARVENTGTRRALLCRGVGVAAGATAIFGSKTAHGQAICFPTASELFFEYDPATSQALTAVIQEIKQLTAKLDQTAEQIAS